jgi:hypothetical protein
MTEHLGNVLIRTYQNIINWLRRGVHGLPAVLVWCRAEPSFSSSRMMPQLPPAAAACDRRAPDASSWSGVPRAPACRSIGGRQQANNAELLRQGITGIIPQMTLPSESPLAPVQRSSAWYKHHCTSYVAIVDSTHPAHAMSYPHLVKQLKDRECPMLCRHLDGCPLLPVQLGG